MSTPEFHSNTFDQRMPFWSASEKDLCWRVLRSSSSQELLQRDRLVAPRFPAALVSGGHHLGLGPWSGSILWPTRPARRRSCFVGSVSPVAGARPAAAASTAATTTSAS